MILTITPNPALDVSGVVESIVPNEKCYVFDEKRHPGGNAVNAAIMAKNLGGQVLASGFIGGATGSEYLALLSEEGVTHRFVKIKQSTRTNVTVSLRAGHEQTRLSFPGPKVLRQEVAALLKLIQRTKCQQLVIGGSLPQGLGGSFVKRVIAAGRGKGIPVTVDMPGKVLAEVWQSGPYLIKPNLVEFQEMVGSQVKSCAEVLASARKFTSKVALICVSSVEGGALLITRDAAVFGKIPPIAIRSTVGAGDSMVGAMNYVIAKLGPEKALKQLDEVLRYGLAASAATLTNKGLEIGNKIDVKKFLSRITVERM